MLYGLWDPELGKVVMGPTNTLPNDIRIMSTEDRIQHNWYEVEYRYTDPNYDPWFQEVTSIAPYVEAGTKLVLSCDTKWKPIAELVEIKNTQINELRDELATSGFFFGGLKFDSDEAARSNITGSVTMINSGLLIQATDPNATVAPETMQWTLFDNSTVMLTTNELLSIGLLMGGWISQIFVAGRLHKDAVSNLTTPEEVVAYDPELSLWPSNDLGGSIHSRKAG